MTLGSLIASKPLTPKISAVGSVGAVGGVPRDAQLPVTTPEAGQEGRGLLSPRGSFLLKDSVLLGASLLTAAKSLRAARRRCA
jgi:uncharacterized membrane protein YkgB